MIPDFNFTPKSQRVCFFFFKTSDCFLRDIYYIYLFIFNFKSPSVSAACNIPIWPYSYVVYFLLNID